MFEAQNPELFETLCAELAQALITQRGGETLEINVDEYFPHVRVCLTGGFRVSYGSACVGVLFWIFALIRT